MADSRIKILFLSPHLGHGGAERQISYFLKFLDNSIYNPILILSEKKGAYLNEIPEETEIHELAPIPRYVGYGFILYRIIKLINNINPDIIYSNIWDTNIVNLLANRLSSVQCKSLICIENNYDKNKARILRKWLYPQSDLIIACSNGIAEQLKTIVKIPPGKLKMIYNSVDIKMVREKMQESVEDDLFVNGQDTIVTAGRLCEQKGYFHLLQAIRILNDQVPVQLLVLGDGPDKRKLEQYIEKLKLKNRVRLLGFQNNPFKYMAKADVFVLSSLWEGFGCVLPEAQVCGTPIVSTDTDFGPKEILDNGEAGWLVPVSDKEKLAASLKKALNEKKLSKQFVKNGYEMVEKNFAVEKMIQQYEIVFQEVCN